MTFTLTAVKQHSKADDIWKDCYCYDDEHVTAEPLVEITTETIDSLFNLIEIDEPNAIDITFGQDYLHNPEFTLTDSGIVVLLTRIVEDSGGWYYTALPIEPEHAYFTTVEEQESLKLVWLCEHLLDYFSTPPEKFYVKITPTDETR